MSFPVLFYNIYENRAGLARGDSTVNVKVLLKLLLTE